MNVLEKEIEDMIWHGLQENRPLLRKKGLWVWENTIYLRQVDLGSYGIADLIGFNVQPKQDGFRYINVHIIEIKKEEVNSTTFFQAIRYARGITRLIEKKLKNTTCICGISLIGKTIDNKSDFVYLPDICNNVALYTYSLDFQHGITFTREFDYYARNESFANIDNIRIAAIRMVSEQIKNRKQEDLPF